jgi:hypothetical protein
MAIWWWLAVGLIFCVGRFDRERRKNRQPLVPNLWRN